MDYIYLNELYPNQNIEYGSETLGIPANEGFLDKIGDGFNKFFNKYTSINDKYIEKFNKLSDEEFTKRVSDIKMNTIPLDKFIKANEYYSKLIDKICKEVDKEVNKMKWYQSKNQTDNKYLNKNFIVDIVNKIEKDEMRLYGLAKLKKNSNLLNLGYKNKNSIKSIFTLNRNIGSHISKTLSRLNKTVIDSVYYTGNTVMVNTKVIFSSLYTLLNDIFNYLKDIYSEVVKIFQTIDEYK